MSDLWNCAGVCLGMGGKVICERVCIQSGSCTCKLFTARPAGRLRYGSIYPVVKTLIGCITLDARLQTSWLYSPDNEYTPANTKIAKEGRNRDVTVVQRD